MPATLWRHIFQQSWGLPWWLSGKESPADIGDAGSISGWKEPLEKEMATHSSILTCEPGRLQSMGSQKSDMTERLILPTHKLHFPSIPSFILSWVSSTNFFFFLWCGSPSKSPLNLLQHCFCSMPWLSGRKTCGIPAPWPRIETAPPALGNKVPTIELPEKSQ